MAADDTGASSDWEQRAEDRFPAHTPELQAGEEHHANPLDQSQADRASANFSIDIPELAPQLRNLDTWIQEAAAAAGLVDKQRYIPMVKDSKREGYAPTLSAKCQLPDGTRTDLDFDWRAARVCPVLQLRGIWVQGHQYGPSIDVIDLLVFTEGEVCPFPDIPMREMLV